MQRPYLTQVAKEFAYGKGGRYWLLKMFQRELQLLRRRGQGIGAKLWQLRKEPERRIANSQEAVHQQGCLSAVSGAQDVTERQDGAKRMVKQRLVDEKL